MTSQADYTENKNLQNSDCQIIEENDGNKLDNVEQNIEQTALTLNVQNKINNLHYSILNMKSKRKINSAKQKILNNHLGTSVKNYYEICNFLDCDLFFYIDIDLSNDIGTRGTILVKNESGKSHISSNQLLKIGQTIKMLREKSNIKTQAFSNKLGISRQTLAKLESGGISTPLVHYLNAADLLGIDIKIIIQQK